MYLRLGALWSMPAGRDMQIIEFSDFARRRMARGAALDIPAIARPALPAGDRWAALHAEEPDTLDEAIENDEDFWSDLNFRLAYPTHRMRRH
jgi:hypothetical protein